MKLSCSLIGAVGLTAAAVSYYICPANKITKVHTLEFPLMFASHSEKTPLYFLPKGTTLYFDKSYPEGFTRYKIYVNVDRFPLTTTELLDPATIRPITAFAMEKTDLQRLLERNPVTKDDLAAILKSGQLTKDEIRDLLAEYSK